MFTATIMTLPAILSLLHRKLHSELSLKSARTWTVVSVSPQSHLYYQVYGRQTPGKPSDVSSLEVCQHLNWGTMQWKWKTIEIHKEHDIVLWNSSLVLVTIYYDVMWPYVIITVYRNMNFGDISIMCFAFWWQWFLPSECMSVKMGQLITPENAT